MMLISPADKKTGLRWSIAAFSQALINGLLIYIYSSSRLAQTSVSTRLPPPRQNPIPDSALCCVRSLTPVSSSSFSSDMLLIDSGPSESGRLQGQWTHRCAKYHRRQLTSADEMTCREK